MKEPIRYSILCTVLLAFAQYGTLSAAESDSKPMSREDSVLTTVTASVEAINLTNREVTLKGPLGNTVTFTVDQQVKRLDEVKVGDFVRADYYVSFAAELRKPTSEEKANPIQLVEGAGKAPPGTSPAAGGLRQYKIVTTIEGLDRPTRTITVRGPLGNYLTARVADPSRLTQARIGDTVVVIYTEALAISLEKVDKKGSE
jgi:hypothetical protein